MMEKLNIFLVDDDKVILKMMESILTKAGHTVYTTTSNFTAMEQIAKTMPDLVVLDLMMSQVSGMDICRKIKSDPKFAAIKVIFISSKAFEYDRKRAFDLGADAYIIKPINMKTFNQHVERIAADLMELTYWGVRGTLPVSDRNALFYGGNTNCVSLELPRGKLFIFDAGTGIKNLSDHLVAQQQRGIEGKIFISHPHWDHINAFPFFAPLYIQGNEFEVIGPSHGDVTMREMISNQMDGVYFPIRIKEFASRVYFKNILEDSLELEGIKISTMLLNHPGNCLGYRIDYQGRSVCYVTDNELPLQESNYFNATYRDKLARFVEGSDILITDVTYTDKEYESRVLWGHSSVSQVADLAHRGQVKCIHLYHHDPSQMDAEIEAKFVMMQRALESLGSKTHCVAPRERETFKI